MESAAGLYAIGSGVSALAGSPASSLVFEWISNWYQKKRLAKRVRGLILLKGSTTMCQKLTTSDVVYIDCDSLLQTLQAPKDAEELAKAPTGVNPVDAMLCYSVIKRHIVNICAVFKGKIVLVSKSVDLLHALPVKAENIYFAAFSKDMEENIGVIYANEKEHHESQLNKFRILREIDEAHTYIVDSLKDLYDKTAIHFGSKRNQL
jgi:hypothetical protein